MFHNNPMLKTAMKYRLYPTKAQRRILEETLELCRWVYNQTLATRKEAYEQRGTSLSHRDIQNMLPAWKSEKPELKRAHSLVLQNAQIRVDFAYKAFFCRVKAGEGEVGYPRFKGKGRYRSITYPQYGNGVSVENGKLHLSKIGDIPIKLHRPINGAIKTVTVQRDKLGKWYVSFSLEVEPRPAIKTQRVVGIDMGLTYYMTFSDGTTVDNPRFFRRDQKALAKAQRQYDRYKYQEGKERTAEEKQLANEYGKRVCKIHERIANRRRDFAHQQSRKLVNTYDVIAFEKLDIQGMMHNGKASSKAQKRGMNKSIGDAAWQQLRQYTLFKAESAGKVCVEVDPRGTSQRCSRCGADVPKDLSVRVHACPHCGLEIDRDLNSAINILALGLQSVGTIPRSPSVNAWE